MSKFFFWNDWLRKSRDVSDSSWHEPPCEDLSDFYRDDSDDSDENLSDFFEHDANNMQSEEMPQVAVETNETSLRSHMKSFKQNYCNLI